MERLDKFLCDSGAGTRSQVKGILKAGRVTVDGKPEKDPSRKVDPAVQTICLDGESLGGMRRMVVMLNKPAGYVTATEDPVEKTVMELLPKEWKHLDLKPPIERAVPTASRCESERIDDAGRISLLRSIPDVF